MRFRVFAAVCLSLSTPLACAGSSSQQAKSSCSASCPSGSTWNGKECLWSEAKVACPPGSRFKGGQCIPSVRTGHVDMQRLIEISDAGRARKAALKDDFDKKQKKLDEEAARLTEEKKVIDSGKLSGDPKKLREKKYAEDLAALQATYVRFQDDLKSREQAMLGELLVEVRRAASTVGEREGMSAVFSDQETLWVTAAQAAEVSTLKGVPRIDLTDAIAKELDKNVK